MTKSALKNDKEEYDRFMLSIDKAKGLTQRKRYYYSDYGFSNMKDVVLGKTDKLIKNKENYDKHHLENIVKWWRNKACSRFTTLQTENRIRTEQEVWTGDKPIDIIR